VLAKVTKLLKYQQQRSREHFNLLLVSSCNLNNFNNFVTLASTRFRLSKGDAGGFETCRSTYEYI
jgi:hypothetical protein